MTRRLDAARRLLARVHVASFGWGFAAQALSSATTFLLTVVGGRAAGPAGLGIVVIGWTAYLVMLGLQNALVTKPLVSISAAAPRHERIQAARRGLTAAAVLAAVGTATFAVAGAAVPGEVGRGLLLFAPWLAVALIQDYWRSLLFRDGRAAAAAVNDASWLVVMAALVGPAWVVGTDASIVAAWGGGALAGCALGFAQTRVAPASIRSAREWWARDVWPFSRWLALEGCFYSAATAVAAIVLNAVAGPSALGGLRAAQSVFAPLTLVSPAIHLPGLPAMAKAVAASPRAGLTLARRLSLFALAVTGTYVVAINTVGAFLIPFLFGDSFERYRDLALPIGIWQLIAAGGVGLTLLLMARTRGQDLLFFRVVESSSILALVAVLASRFGVDGAAWAYVVGAAIGMLVLVGCALRGQRHELSRERAGVAAEAR